MKAKNVAGFRNYDSSEFAAVTPVLDDDDALEALWKKESSLQEFVAADQFKSYDELKTRLGYVLGNKTASRPVIDDEFSNEDSDRGSAEELVTAAVSKSPAVEEDDDPLKYFAKLAE